MKRIINVLAIGLFLGFMGWGILILTDTPLAPIQRVVIQSPRPTLDPKRIMQALRPLVEKSFFTVNIKKIRATLQGFPEIEQALIERQWPNTLLIALEPTTLIAQLNQTSWINLYGEKILSQNLFDQEKNWIIVNAPDEETILVLDYYYRMQTQLRTLKLEISSLSLDSAGNWTLQLQNGLYLKLGQQEILQRLKRFASVYGTVFLSSPHRATEVDLRYAHGMAVKWQN